MNTLTLIDRAFFLKRSALFSTLDLDLLLSIADKLHAVHFDAGEIIFTEEEEGFRMYFILKGRVELKNKEGSLIILGPEDFFGEESMFNEKLRAYAAVAETDIILFALTRTHLLTIISECPAVAIGLLQIYTLANPFRGKLPE